MAELYSKTLYPAGVTLVVSVDERGGDVSCYGADDAGVFEVPAAEMRAIGDACHRAADIIEGCEPEKYTGAVPCVDCGRLYSADDPTAMLTCVPNCGIGNSCPGPMRRAELRAHGFSNRDVQRIERIRAQAKAAKS